MERIYEDTELFGFKVETDSTFQCAPHKHMTDADLDAGLGAATVPSAGFPASVYR